VRTPVRDLKEAIPNMTNIEESDVIRGVSRVLLSPLSDPRGRLVETFRKAWFPDRRWDCLQANASYSAAGVLRGLHYHRRQADYWFVARGRIRVGLCDLRRSSSTHLASDTFEMCDDGAAGLFIPAGVAHGFLALEEAVMTYVVDNYYDGTDEHGVAWNDPEIGLDWGIASPQLSPRDASNPILKEIPTAEMPE
jgi:dTDP-4-dehydrorhamnose 3,5-epimerase